MSARRRVLRLVLRLARRLLWGALAAGGLALSALVFAGAAKAEAALSGAPPEPAGYRGEPYRAPVPATLDGAPALSTAQAAALHAAGAAFIDVLPRVPKPANLPPGTIWRDRPHRTIPGALWLPNVGYEALSAADEAYFRAGLEAAAPDRAAPVVIFCLDECWMSWNAARRARAWGWTGARWYAEGMDGWMFEDLPTTPAEPAAF